MPRVLDICFVFNHNVISKHFTQINTSSKIIYGSCMGRLDSYWNTSPQESLVDQPPDLVEQGAARMIFEFPHSCMIWHRIAPLAAIWKVGSFCFL
jgi:hypothetical protein